MINNIELRIPEEKKPLKFRFVTTASSRFPRRYKKLPRQNKHSSHKQRKQSTRPHKKQTPPKTRQPVEKTHIFKGLPRVENVALLVAPRRLPGWLLGLAADALHGYIRADTRSLGRCTGESESLATERRRSARRGRGIAPQPAAAISLCSAPPRFARHPPIY